MELRIERERTLKVMSSCNARQKTAIKRQRKTQKRDVLQRRLNVIVLSLLSSTHSSSFFLFQVPPNKVGSEVELNSVTTDFMK